MTKRRVVGRIYRMKYSWKGSKERQRHKNRIKRSEQARLVYVKNINRNIPTTWRWAHGDRAEGDFHKEVYSLKDQYGRTKTGRTEWESGELLGEFIEWNTVERVIKTETDTRTEFKKNRSEQHPHLVQMSPQGLVWWHIIMSWVVLSKKLDWSVMVTVSVTGKVKNSSECSSGWYLFMKVSLSPDIILCGWLGLSTN